MILIILAVGTLNIACFFIGAKVGQKVSKGETIETPALNFVKWQRNAKARKAAEEAQERYDTILRNIERFDGTERGQEDVPRG